MRRLLVIGTIGFLAAFAVTVVLVAGHTPPAAARAAAHSRPRVSPRSSRSRVAQAAQATLGQTCFVGATTCSIHPCVEFTGAAPAVLETATSVASVPAPRSSCRRAMPSAPTAQVRTTLSPRGRSGAIGGGTLASPLTEVLPSLQRRLSRLPSRSR